MSDKKPLENDNGQTFATEVTMVDEKQAAETAPSAENGGKTFATEVTMVDEKHATAEEDPTVALSKIPESKAAAAAAGLQPGDRLDRYVVVRKLGQGGMGSVYLVRHETLGVFRAAKVLSHALYARGGEFVNRFIQEAKIACAISHPNIVNVLDVGEDAGHGMCYIIMEYVDGGTVHNVLRASKRFSELHALIIVEAAAEALQAASAQKIVHRDIKPDNIMLTRRGEVKLADLGIAKNNEEDVQLTRSHVMMGTPAYLAPEQARDAHSVDVRADIYSLGATLYEMLTGEIPYPGKSTYDILAKLMSSPVPDPRVLAPNVSPQTAKLVMRMLAKEAKHRPASAAELLKEIRSLNVLPSDLDPQQSIRELLEESGAGKYSPTSGTSVTGKPPSIWLTRRKPVLIAGAAAALVLIAGIPLALMWATRDSGSPAPAPKNTPTAAVSPAAAVTPVKTETQKAADAVKADARKAAETVKTEAAKAADAVKADARKAAETVRTEAKKAADAAIKAETRKAAEDAAAKAETQKTAAVTPVKTETQKAADAVRTDVPKTAETVRTEPPRTVSPAAATTPPALPAPATISVSAEIDPVGARAVLNNDQGKTVAERTVPISGRIRFDLPEGRYMLRVSAPGRESIERVFPVSSRRTITGVKIILPQSLALCTLSFYGSPKLLEYARNNGVEIRVDNGSWTRVTKFPHQLEVSRQTHTLELRGQGVKPLSQSLRVAPDQTSCSAEFYLSAQEARVEIAAPANEVVQINLTGIWEPLHNSVRLPPFRAYELKWRVSGKEQRPVSIPELMPGTVRKVTLELPRKTVLPGAAEFAEAEKLAKEEKYAEAVEKYAAASEKGHPEADYQLGYFAETGKGRWFSSDTDALGFYRRGAAAPRNDARAQYRIGLFYENGRGGLARDLKTALKWYVRAAERHNPDAMYRLGMAYKSGEGDLAIDFNKMLANFSAAAEAGHADAQYELGFCYENGLGLPISVSQAKFWYDKAAAQGVEKAALRGKALEIK